MAEESKTFSLGPHNDNSEDIILHAEEVIQAVAMQALDDRSLDQGNEQISH